MTTSAESIRGDSTILQAISVTNCKKKGTLTKQKAQKIIEWIIGVEDLWRKLALSRTDLGDLWERWKRLLHELKCPVSPCSFILPSVSPDTCDMGFNHVSSQIMHRINEWRHEWFILWDVVKKFTYKMCFIFVGSEIATIKCS